MWYYQGRDTLPSSSKVFWSYDRQRDISQSMASARQLSGILGTASSRTVLSLGAPGWRHKEEQFCYPYLSRMLLDYLLHLQIMWLLRGLNHPKSEHSFCLLMTEGEITNTPTQILWDVFQMTWLIFFFFPFPPKALPDLCFNTLQLRGTQKNKTNQNKNLHIYSDLKSEKYYFFKICNYIRYLIQIDLSILYR